jgi:hypothetical protein
MAHGEYLLFIDSDMTLAPNVVTECLAAVGNGVTPGVVIPEESVGEGFLAHCRALERSCYRDDDAVEAARFFPWTLFEQAGGFDENLTAMEDWDLMIRIAKGRHLPRTASCIYHDEGRLKLTAALGKKRYYAASSIYYLRKHGISTLGQANLVFRPAFLRNWRRLLRRPILTIGFLSLKGLESAAVLWGILEAETRGEIGRVSR